MIVAAAVGVATAAAAASVLMCVVNKYPSIKPFSLWYVSWICVCVWIETFHLAKNFKSKANLHANKSVMLVEYT